MFNTFTHVVLNSYKSSSALNSYWFVSKMCIVSQKADEIFLQVSELIIRDLRTSLLGCKGLDGEGIENKTHL